ncbi:ester cyclase [Mesorhizobium loti]|nr:ester cyclase [Mesorhizobium loti]PLP57196.1 ester cyclase [Mesorhizobium loti]
MTRDELITTYRRYIDCLNRQDWGELQEFVHDDVRYNDLHVGLAGYRSMLEGDFRAIPDLRFQIELLIADSPHVACRLHFDCTPIGTLFDLPVNGRRVQFEENVFYEFAGERIQKVRSIIDKAAIARQL